jgi:hypothetical protein
MRIHTRDTVIVTELIQNALDCDADILSFSLDSLPTTGDRQLVFSHNGFPFTARDVDAITHFNGSCKPPNRIGFMGIGFKAVYRVSCRPEVHSGPFHFAFEPHEDYSHHAIQGRICPYVPSPIESFQNSSSDGQAEDDGEMTTFVLPLRPEATVAVSEAMSGIDPVMVVLLRSAGARIRKVVLPGRTIEVTQDGHVSVNGEVQQWGASDATVTIRHDSKEWQKFTASSGRTVDDTATSHQETVTVAFPLGDGKKDASAGACPGRLHAFLPTQEVLKDAFHIHGNFAIDSDRAYLPEKGPNTWNHLLLRQAGKALARLLDKAKTDPAADWLQYYRVVPPFAERILDPAYADTYAALQEGFLEELFDGQRVPVDCPGPVDSVRLVDASQAVLIDRRLRPALDTAKWCELLGPNRYPVSAQLPPFWDTLLTTGHEPTTRGPVETFGLSEVLDVLSDPTWFSRILEGAGSSGRVFVCTHLLCVCAVAGMDVAAAKRVHLLLDPDLAPVGTSTTGISLFRNPEGRIPSLPASVASGIRYLHRLHTAFFRRSSMDFPGRQFGAIDDNTLKAGLQLFDQMAPSLTAKAVIEKFVAPVFHKVLTPEDSPAPSTEECLDLTRFAFNAWKNESSLASVISESVLLLGQSSDERLWWCQPSVVWLGAPFPHGRDLDLFLRGLPSVKFLSGQYLEDIESTDHERFAIFAGAIGVRHAISHTESTATFWDGQWAEFATALGTPDHPDPGNHNYGLSATDFDWEPAVKEALDRTMENISVPAQRTSAMQAFSRLLEDAWPRLRHATKKKGKYHVARATEHTTLPGGRSTLAVRLQDSAWVPVKNRPTLLLQPRQCGLPSLGIEKYSGLTGVSIADLEFTNADLISFLGFLDSPPDLAPLDRLRAEARAFPKSPVNIATIRSLYHEIAAESPDGAGITELRRAFWAEPLIYVPDGTGSFVDASRTVWHGTEDLEGFLRPLSSVYGDLESFFTEQIGVPRAIEDIHYVRYLVRHVWSDPEAAVSDVRRRNVLKTYRILIRWAASGLLDGPGSPPEAAIFLANPLFRGDCGRHKAWHSAAGKTVVYRDDPVLAELLAGQDRFILESFLSQIDRAEDAMEPFLRQTGVRRATEIVTITLRHDAVAALPDATSVRANLAHCLQAVVVGLRHLADADDRKDDQAARVETAATQLAADAGAGLPVLYAANLTRIHRVDGLPDREVPVGAAIQQTVIGAATECRLLVAEMECRDVASELAREICAHLKTMELSGRIREPVEQFLQDLTGSLNLSTDNFLARLKRAVRRHFPGLSGMAEPIGSEEAEKHAEPGSAPSGDGVTQPNAVGESHSASTGNGGSHGPPPLTPDRDDKQQDSGDDLVLPPIDEQTATTVNLTVEDCAESSSSQSSKKVGIERDTSWKPRDPARDRKVGERGELLAMRYELQRLRDEGHPDPAGIVDHVSLRDRGSPYDIRSVIKVEGRWEPLYIEVKASTDSAAESFPMGSNEWALAIDPSIHHRVYHVRGVIGKGPQIRVINLQSLYRAGRVGVQGETLRIFVRPSPDTAQS